MKILRYVNTVQLHSKYAVLLPHLNKNKANIKIDFSFYGLLPLNNHDGFTKTKNVWRTFSNDVYKTLGMIYLKDLIY